MTAPSMTEQGRATRERIVAAAAALIGEHGVSGTSLDDIRAATNSSKSQLYHYFGDKHGLVQAVIDHQSAVVLGAQAEALEAVQDWGDLERWVDWMVAVVEQQGARGGCPIGTLAAALADTDESFRTALARKGLRTSLVLRLCFIRTAPGTRRLRARPLRCVRP